MSRVAKLLVATGALVALLFGWLAFRHRHLEAAPSEADAAWERLVSFDAKRRSQTDFAKLATWDRVSGPDPYVFDRSPARHASSGSFAEATPWSFSMPRSTRSSGSKHRQAPSRSRSGEDGTVIVAGELSTTLARYGWKDGSLVPNGTFQLDGVRAIRDLALGPRGWIYAVEEHEGRLVGFRIERGKDAEHLGALVQIKVGNGPFASSASTTCSSPTAFSITRWSS